MSYRYYSSVIHIMRSKRLSRGSFWKLIFLLLCAFAIFTYFYLVMNVAWTLQISTSRQKCNKSTLCESSPSSVNGSPGASNNSITLFVRVGGEVAELRRRFYCIFYRSSVLFWPASLGKTVIVFDEESEQDHILANNLTRQMKEHFPDRHFEILYEPLPNDSTVLEFPGCLKTPGYNRQLWSSFFIDLYTNDSIIAWMDTDAWFGSPVTKSTIFNGTKLRVLGTECSVQKRSWVRMWMHTTEVALGLPYIADFMTYFPAYIYRDTFTHCREYILKRFNTSNFEKAFKQFYTRGQYISPVIIIFNYAWYFERDRYAWNLEICTNLTQYNKRLPSNHTVGPEHLVNTLPVPQTAFHAPQMPNMGPYVRGSYCLSHEAAGNAKCSNYSASLRNNLVLFVHDIVRSDMPVIPPQCSGVHEDDCLQILERHYSQVDSEIKQNTRKMDWSDLETVDKLANEVQIKCSPMK